MERIEEVRDIRGRPSKMQVYLWNTVVPLRPEERIDKEAYERTLIADEEEQEAANGRG